MRDTDRDLMTVNEMVRPVQGSCSAPTEFHELDPGKLFAHNLSPGEWYIDVRDFGQGAMQHMRSTATSTASACCSYAACLVERKPLRSVFLPCSAFSQEHVHGSGRQRAGLGAAPYAQRHNARPYRRAVHAGAAIGANPGTAVVWRDRLLARAPRLAEQQHWRALGAAARPRRQDQQWQLSRSLPDMNSRGLLALSTVPASAALARHADGGSAQ
ncbi:hypothetical protein ACU4GD_22115 [Cupriavidus basilensis]